MVMQRLYISNKDRIQGKSYDFLLSDVSGSYTTSSTFIAKVVQVDFENFAYTIIQGQNDTFLYYLRAPGGIQYTINVTIPQGVYPIIGTGGLLEYIQSKQNTIAPANVITWNYDSVSKKIFLKVNVANYYINIPKTIDPAFPFQESNSQLRLIDAFGVNNFSGEKTSTQNAPINTTIYGETTVDISTSAFMDIALSLPSSTLSTANLNRMVVARVPVGVPYGDVVSFMENHPLEFLLNTQQMNSMRITLYNQWNQFYVLPDNANLSIVIQLENVD